MTKHGKLINEFQQQSAQKRDRNKIGNVIVLFQQRSYLFGKRQADNNYFFLNICMFAFFVDMRFEHK